MPTLTGFITGNPVRGTVHPTGWDRPRGNTDFRMTQDFGPSRLSVEPTIYWPGGEGIPRGTYANFHRGIDLGNQRCGYDVLAAKGGTIAFAGIDGTGNRVVIINHGKGVRTWYGHLGSENVYVGQKVSQGQKIGTVGSSAATACHLHYAIEVDHDGEGPFEWVDPWRRMKQNVRIWPNSVGVNIRNAPDLSKDGVYRQSTAEDVKTKFRWGGLVTGASYEVNGRTSNKWDKMYVGGRWRYIASLLSSVSQR